jgi:Flp pilus assembly protein TadD
MKALPRSICTLLALLAPVLAVGAPSEAQVRAIAAAATDYDTAKKAIQREDWKGAIAALESAERLDPQDADVQNLLGYSYRKIEKLDEAFKHYLRALELNPRHLGAHEYLGRAYLMAGKPELAREHLAQLEKYCWEKCPERDSLKQAIAEWDPWKSSVRTGRSY